MMSKGEKDIYSYLEWKYNKYSIKQYVDVILCYNMHDDKLMYVVKSNRNF